MDQSIEVATDRDPSANLAVGTLQAALDVFMKDKGAREIDYVHGTEPVVEHYRATGLLVPLHAERSVNEVYAEITDAIAELEGRRA